MTHPLATRFVLAFAVLATPALATQQSCGVFSPEFSGGGFDRSPVDFELFDFGAGPRLVAAGEFTVAGSVQARRVAQWDGSAWAEVGQGFNGDAFDVEGIDLGSGAELFATGRFQTSAGQTRNRIARWNGSSWDALGSGLNNWGWALCEYPTPAGNRLVVGGEFTTAGGQPALRVAMWDGTSWSAMGAGLGQQLASQRVLALAMHDDGSGPALYASGQFPGGVARFDGSQWSVVGGGLVGTPQSLASYDDGQGNRLLLVGGNFANGPTSVLKGWNGTSWQDLGLTGFLGGVDSIVVRQESSGPAAYLAGSFEPELGASSTVRLVARWTPTSITSFPPLLERVRTLEFFDSGAGVELIAGGTFSYVPSAPVPQLDRVARFSAGQWLPVEPARQALYANPNASFQHAQVVRAWTNPVTGERDLYVGGHIFGSASDSSLRHLARWDGTTIHAVGGPVSTPVYSLGEWRRTATGAPELVVGTTDGVRSFDGTTWSTLGTPTLVLARTFAEFTPPGASAPLLIAGSSSGLPGVAGSFVQQFDGTSWLPMGSGVNLGVEAAVTWDAPGPLPEGVYVGGIFFNAGGQAASGVALWDGTSWNALGNPAFQSVYELRVWDDGTGEALFANTNQGLFRFDGASWTALGPLGVLLEPYDDGSGPALYLSDRVRLRNGVQEPFGAATLNAPYSVAAHHWVDQYGISQGLFFTGPFEVLGGTPAMGLARYWNPCGYATTYCSAKVNSLGCTPQIGWSGVPSATGSSPFVISASNVLNQKSGLLFYGATGRIAKAFQGGTLCVRSPVRRTPVRVSGGSLGAPDCSGSFALDFTPYLQGSVGPGFGFGDTVNVQWWYRDPQSSFSTGLTDALEFQARP
ncbi:MAG: hypothetical protein NTV21_12865 [Planctomycetota bacterium]|nr:hypothetical protein [Planctomycetota bacterium]